MISIAVMSQTHVMYMKMRRCEHDEIRFEAVSFESIKGCTATGKSVTQRSQFPVHLPQRHIVWGVVPHVQHHEEVVKSFLQFRQHRMM